MAWKYVGMSPYNYCGNDPVNLVDPDGTRIVVYGSNAFQSKYNDTRSWLKEMNCDQLLVDIEKNPNIVVEIVEGGLNQIIKTRHSKSSHPKLTGVTIEWNPNVFMKNKSTYYSPAVTIMHEIKHVWDAMTDYNNYRTDISNGMNSYSNMAEYKAILFETGIAKQLEELPPDATISRNNSLGEIGMSTEGLSAMQQSTIAKHTNYPQIPKIDPPVILNKLLNNE